MAEINKLAKIDQMEIIEALSALTPERLASDHSVIGAFHREGKTFYRLRVNDFRIYFEVRESNLHCDLILHKHTLADFVFRMKLPLTEEQQLEQDQNFWKYLESLKK